MATATSSRAPAGALALAVLRLAGVCGVITATSITDGLAPVAAPPVRSVELPDSLETIEPAPRPGELVARPARRPALLTAGSPTRAATLGLRPAAPVTPLLSIPRVDLAAAVTPLPAVVPAVTPVVTSVVTPVLDAVRDLAGVDTTTKAKAPKAAKGAKGGNGAKAAKAAKEAKPKGDARHGGRGTSR